MAFPLNNEELAKALDKISTYPKEEQDDLGRAAATLIRAQEDNALLLAAALARAEGYIPAGESEALRQQLLKDFGGN